MKQIANWWTEVWLSRIDPLPVGIFRISLGLLLLLMLIALCPSWEQFYGPEGMLSLSRPESASLQGGWSVFAWVGRAVPVRLFWWIGLLAAAALTVGWQTRLATVLLYLLQASMVHRNPMVVNGEDLVFRMLLFYSCFAPLGAALSLDRWIRTRRLGWASAGAEPPRPLVWPVRLMQVNIALIYVFSLPAKLADPSGEWVRGDGLYWSMMNNMWSLWPWKPLFYDDHLLLSRLMTYGTILAEGTFPLLVWFRKTRPYVLAGITALHLGIALVVANVTFFTLAMACAFWLFVPAETLRRLARALNMMGAQAATRFGLSHSGA